MAVQRLFWLGMHKILVQTELPRLRALGYEVFNPPYLSSVKDQSACLDWDANQTTTLPTEVFEALSHYNFFYNDISETIAKLLNTYFDAVIVTISSAWLIDILKCYQGKVIYRTYGQHYVLSQDLAHHKFMRHIVSRDNFWFVPHAAEAVIEEDSWLREREWIVPYCLQDDVFELTDTWKRTPKGHKIAISCPNIANPYFQEHYKFLKANFSESYYKYYGVQLSKINDRQVTGTLLRDRQLAQFQKSLGFLYTHTEGRVCYLPPIEMMIIGGPVLYLSGSLLDRFFKHDSPGRCVSIAEAHMKTKWLIQEDHAFIDDVIASQQDVRTRYTPEFVWPIFDHAFQTILRQNNVAPSWLITDVKPTVEKIKRIYIFQHFPSNPILYKDGAYTAFDGIPRVVRQVTMMLATNPNIEIVITARANQVESMNGFFRNIANCERVRILCIHPNEIIPVTKQSNTINFNRKELGRRALHKGIRGVKRLAKKIVPLQYRSPIKKSIIKGISASKIAFRNLSNFVKFFLSRTSQDWHIKLINQDEDCLAVFVPHYYLFQDALYLNKKIVLYLPDYMPHFFHDTGEFTANEGVHTKIGAALVKKSEAILCNSNFTKSYLPICRLQVPPEKIHIAYLPFLNTTTANSAKKHVELSDKILSKPYLFYPTRPHPNKNLAFLLRVFDRLVTEGSDIHLVLTTTLEHDPKAKKMLSLLKHKNKIIFLDVVTDDILESLYRKAAALCFTSLAEGNFPPQIHEALQYDTPIVASRLNFITERIPDHLLDSMIFCEPNNEDDFVAGCKLAMDNREATLDKQRAVYKAVNSEDLTACFRNKILEIFSLA